LRLELQVLAAAREVRQKAATAAAAVEQAMKARVPEKSKKSKPEKDERNLKVRNNLNLCEHFVYNSKNVYAHILKCQPFSRGCLYLISVIANM
jgi:hypothetical protein